MGLNIPNQIYGNWTNPCKTEYIYTYIYRTWCGQGKHLLPEIPKNEIEFLVHGYTEEYSFSRRFIDSLSSRLNVATIMDFIKIAKKFCRNDIAMCHERLNFPMDSPIHMGTSLGAIESSITFWRRRRNMIGLCLLMSQVVRPVAG